MRSTQSGRIVKSRKGNGTPHQKNHRWESFTTKISKLHSLDPLRRVRRHDLEVENLETTTSYFRNGMEKWADMNISKQFTLFRRDVRPYYDSLPQILHSQDKIMELLAKYISVHEKESLEPLLDLLTALAHDLGLRFEKHYPTALSLITGIASRPQDAAVVEWTFGCLAFLFKYLSKLLVSDIRPTFDALAPLLGKARNPPHIARFAAEALSFLVKKAAAPANREKALPMLIEHVRQDLEANRDSRQFGLYHHGLMTMFAEAIKGQGHNIHTSGTGVIKSLIASVPNDECLSSDPVTWADLVCGVLVSTVHHTTAETFEPIPELIIETATKDEECAVYALRNCLYVRLLGTISGVRRGDRIVNWPPILNCLLESLKALSKKPDGLDNVDLSTVWQQLMVNIAIVWEQAPMDSIIPYITEFTAVTTRDPLMRWFIPFCSYFSDLDSTRFRSLLLKPFQKFIVTHWSEGSNEDMLCVFLPRMAKSYALPSPTDSDNFSLPQSWQDQIVTKFERLEVSPFPEQVTSGGYDKDPKTWRGKCLPKYSALLRVLEAAAVRPSTNGPIAELLLRKLKLALKPSQSLASEEAHFIVSQGFSSYLRICKITGQIDSSLEPLLKAATPRYRRLTGFLEAMIAYEDQLNPRRSPQSESSSNSECDEDPFMKSLVDNLSSSSHQHRSASLKLLSRLSAAPDELDSLATMIQAEQMPLELQNTRFISLHIRKLAANYPQLSKDSWLRRAIPAFLFGQMTVRLAPIWDSAVDALQQISQDKSGEDVICELAFDWIDAPSKRWDGPPKEITASSNAGLTDFECSNLSNLHRRADEAEHVLKCSSEVMLDIFQGNQDLVPLITSNARSQALKVFLAAPGIAERRSRKLVPHLLSWTRDSDEQDDNEMGSEQLPDGSWSLFDKKTLLGVFAQFTNPKVLYQSQQVYDALLGMLANGDVEVQKSALKAILAWKQEGVKPFQENLEYLLDEARFKNELTVLFQGDQQIKPEQRPEIMPVLLRLLYGRSISKKGAASGRHGLHATRLAVLRQLTVDDMGEFLDIALGDLRGVTIIENTQLRENIFDREVLTVRKQVGFLNMMEAMINEMGTDVLSFADKILNAVLYCLVLSSRKINQSNEDTEEDQPAQSSLHRVVRTTSLKCVISLLRNATSFDWTPYKDVFIKEIVSPRLDKLPAETTQGISGTLQFISTLSQIPKTAYFLSVDNRIIQQLMECLKLEKTKDEVKIFALSIVRSLANLSQQPAEQSEFNELIQEEILDPNINFILESIGAVLKSKGEVGRDLLMACVESVVELSPIIQKSVYLTDLVDISVTLLNQPSRRVNPKAKGLLLSMLENFIKLAGADLSAELRDRIYSTISSLFGFFKDRVNRQALSNVLAVLYENDPVSLELSTLCADLNSHDSSRVDEPNYEKRLQAFNVILRPRDVPFTPRDWRPLVYNMTFYIKHDEEYGILSANSADGLCKFIEAAACSEGEEQSKFYDMLSEILIPALYSNAREPSETVRREAVKVFGSLVSRMPSWPPVADLVAINPQPSEDDPDPSFFNNILSPATARQMRALQLLSKVNYHTPLGSKNLTHFFIPLLEQFIFNREEGNDDHGVGAQAASTIADIASSLEWPQYRAILRRYISYIESKPELQKQLIRLLGKFVDTLAAVASKNNSDAMDIDSAATVGPSEKCRLATTMPAHEKLNEDVLTNILPSLVEYLHEKDETTVSSRVPVGIIVVKILQVLPKETLDQKLPGVLTDICHILRSKAWESREMARSTLSTMTSLLGSSYFGFVLNELRGALTKGYQLHILSYTMHTILVNVTPQFQPGDLDYCLDKIVSVIMDDIFGVVGQEKDAEEYTSQTKEVKSRKSQDSMELVARTASVSHLVDLVRPLKALLLEKLDIRMVRKIDDLLSRIASGLFSNSAAGTRDTLVFCYEVIQEVYESQKPRSESRLDPKLRRYLIQKGANKSGDRSTTSKYTFKLVRFAVDVLRSVLKKHDNIRNATNIIGFIPILGDALVGGEEEVKIATFKLLTVLVKVPFKTDDATKLYKVASKEASKCISMSTSTETDLAQSALKLMSVIIRDRRDVVVKDAAVDMLLNKVKDDLTEPLYRHVTFSFLRSILDRKTETATVYDILDYVGTVMITNDDKDTRDLARGAFFQFLRDYPQKKSRWAKQLSFIVANLKYEREGGRLSVMEVVHLLLMKSADDFVQEVAATCFIPLVFVLVNDDSEKCRLAAGELIKEIFRKADKEQTSKFLTLMRSWIEQDDNSSVLQLAFQAFSLYFEAREPASRDRKDANLLLEAAANVLNNYSTFSKDSELIDTVMRMTPILIEKHPSTALSHDRVWQSISIPLSHPDPAVKLSSIRLLRIYLTDFYENNQDASNAQTLTGSHGIQLQPQMVGHLTLYAVGVLSPATVRRWKRRMQKKNSAASFSTDDDGAFPIDNTTELDETLAAEVGRVILMLSKFMDIGSPDTESNGSDAEESGDDEEEWGGLDTEAETTHKTTLHTLFVWLSEILVEETRPNARALVPKVAALDILSILISTLPEASLKPSLNILLTPLHHRLDPLVPTPYSIDEVFNTRYEGLKTKAGEAMDILQKKFGTTVYTQELLAVRERARNRRESRSRKRKIEAVTQPERWGKWKQGKLEKKVKRRKEKGQQNRNRRREY
ncbi:armadillo-type protein [Annulohypoxylon maeteangense]|uniref:armadillo-type protein n=1 Tax=Annulohypoxylon maeteangense TaxID=1927788 RepID=UPI00200879ED|nr:armadillo-type protein [Annulohypoxylon maeteangense]KAI0889620.1 armadillo-type protein [Annulohypoxylon maeteangense]